MYFEKGFPSKMAWINFHPKTFEEKKRKTKTQWGGMQFSHCGSISAGVTGNVVPRVCVSPLWRKYSKEGAVRRFIYKHNSPFMGQNLLLQISTAIGLKIHDFNPFSKLSNVQSLPIMMVSVPLGCIGLGVRIPS